MRRPLANVAHDLAAVAVAILLCLAEVLERKVAKSFSRVRSYLEDALHGLQAASEKGVTQFTLRRFRQPARRTLNDIVFQGGMLVDETGVWVKIVGTRGPETPDTPHGVKHTLTFHGPDGGPSFDEARLGKVEKRYAAGS